MKRKRIKRRVISLDTSNQGNLFGVLPSSAPSVPLAARSTAATAVQFIDPDPRAIRINEVPLEELLKQAGQGAPLKLRELLTSLSFTEFEQVYEPGGRPPYAPRAMIGLILSGILQGITSLRELERLARLDLGCWWLTGAIMPDHSILGRFIQRHAALLTEAFFEQLTRQVLKATSSHTAVLAGDGTIIEAAASRYRLMKAEALQEALAIAKSAAQTAPDDPHAAERITQLEEAQKTLTQRRQARRAQGKDASGLSINPSEPGAIVQQRKDKDPARPSYKPSILANKARVIVACEVHPSSETAIVPTLLDRAQTLGQVDTVLLDAAYFSTNTLTGAAERNIEVLCPQGKFNSEGFIKQSDKYYPKGRFIYDPQADRYRCPNGQQLRPIKRYNGSGQWPAHVRYGTSACRTCAVLTQCTRSQKGRTIKRYAIDATKEALLAQMSSFDVQRRYQQRQGMVEPVFGELRHHQGLNRFRRKGIKAVRVEFALHAMAHNLRRVVAHYLSQLLAFMAALRAHLTLARYGPRYLVPTQLALQWLQRARSAIEAAA